MEHASTPVLTKRRFSALVVVVASLLVLAAPFGRGGATAHAARTRRTKLTTTTTSTTTSTTSTTVAPSVTTSAEPSTSTNSLAGVSTTLAPKYASIVDYVKMAGDQVVVVPNGTYVGGDVTAAHAATSGPLKGWLVLVAQTPGGAVVDLSYPGKALSNGLTAKGDLFLRDGTTQVLFAGFTFVNGAVQVFGDDIRFWYTDHSFPATVWRAEPNWPAGDGSPMYHIAPRTVYLRPGAARVELLGSTLHDTGTSLYVEGNTSDNRVAGLRIQRLSDGQQEGFDPYDVIHPDGIAMVVGGIRGFAVEDSDIDPGGYYKTTGVKAIDRYNSVERLDFRNVWVRNSFGGGLSFISNFGRTVTGSMTGVRAWNNGFDRNDMVDNVGRSIPNWYPSRIYLPVSSYVQSAPSTTEIDPATQWRSVHLFDTWASLFVS